MLEKPAAARALDHRDTGLLQQGKRRLGAAMNELGAHLYRHLQPGFVTRPAAAAYPVARFEHQRRVPALRELRGCSQPGCARAYDQHVEVRCGCVARHGERDAAECDRKGVDSIRPFSLRDV